MKIKVLIHFILLSGLLSVVPNYLDAGHLPTKSYTIFDGLANDRVNKIVRDSRGFLWFCTGEGLSRFDGFEFKNYTQAQGLPNRNINDFFETKDGDLLVATTNGLAVFNPNGTAFHWNILTSKLEQDSTDPPMFRQLLPPNPENEPKMRSILNIAQAADGGIFVGTASALFRLEKTADNWIFHRINSELFSEDTEFTEMRFDSAGYLWLVTGTGIFRMSPDGKVKSMSAEGGGSILVDNIGRIWVGASGTNAGLRLFTISSDGLTANLEKIYRSADGLPQEHSMLALMQTSDGRILLTSNNTLCEFLPGAAGNELKFRVIARGNFQALAEDGGGNLWLGTTEEGAWKLFPGGFTKFDSSDGIPDADITSLFTNAAGEFFITSGTQKILLFTGGRFESVIPNEKTHRSWGISYLDFQSADGDWWISSTTGLQLYSKPKTFFDLSNTQPKKIYSTGDGLSSNEIFNLFQDSRDDVWISTLNKFDTLHRLDHQTGKIYRYSTADGLPKSNGAISFGEDAAGNVWLGFYFGGLARYKNGEFRFFTAKDGIPEGAVRNIFNDKNGHLWVATASRGVFRTDNPTAENPQFVNISTVEGLSSNQANCVTEDNFGQIYIGTGRGVNRINPSNGNIKLYTQADGLPGSVISLCRRTENGSLWFVSRNTLVRFVPQAGNILKPLTVFIDGISVNGITQKVSELGAENVEQMNFASDQHQIKIDYFALGFGTGDRLHYQYKINNQEWSRPDEEKSVTFNLSPGDYQFFVRAVNADAITSDKPAIVSFTIAQPFWRRWWFLLLSALFAVGVILLIERYRAARLREIKDAFGKLSVSEQRFRRMIDQSSLGFVIFSPDGRLRAVNNAYEKFWNITFEQIKDWKMLEDKQLIEAGVSEKLQQAFAGENVSIAPVAYDPQRNSAGVEVGVSAEPRWIQAFAYPVKSEDGELLEVIMVMEDVTEIKNSETRLQNVREDRLRELEQVRKRIAADLHDDIGSSLTQISIFSEVLQQRIDRKNERVLEPLEFIASSSRELVDAMSDIVWAINPSKDFFSELSGKMRRFAADIFTVRNIEFTFDVPHLSEELAVGANIRREVFLIFKESVNNIVKHSGCQNVAIKLSIANSGENAHIRLNIRDDGTGFGGPVRKTGGHGLTSMTERAAGLGGKLEILSNNGTTVNLTVPLGTTLLD